MTKEFTPTRFNISDSTSKVSIEDVPNRIERTRCELRQIREQLCSYRYEPKTIKSHKMFEALLQKVEELKTTNIALLANMRSSSAQTCMQFGNLESHFEALKELQMGIEAYRQEIIRH